jgi:hypothetical protein
MGRILLKGNNQRIRMKLTLTMNGFTHSTESEGDDLNVEELVYQMRGLLVLAGYHPSSVDQYFQEGEYIWGLNDEAENNSK